MRLYNLPNHEANMILKAQAAKALELQLVKGELRGEGGWQSSLGCPKSVLETALSEAIGNKDWPAAACYSNMLYVRQLAGEK